MLKSNFPVRQEIIRSCYIDACRLEVRTLKPGNVHIFSEGHGMTVLDFDRSAEVSAPFLSDPHLSVGTRIRKSIEATINILRTNTNLGIVLLCAPIAAAAGPQGRGECLKERVIFILNTLTHEDACEAYKAIAKAKPAGLGNVLEGDVANSPPMGWTLLDAMKKSTPHDLIAAQYSRSCSDIFESAECFKNYLEQGASTEDALAFVYLQKLSKIKDTHIARKHGNISAEWVLKTSKLVFEDLNVSQAQALSSPPIQEKLLAFDKELKSRGYNPGSLADVMCASAFFYFVQSSLSQRS